LDITELAVNVSTLPASCASLGANVLAFDHNNLGLPANFPDRLQRKVTGLGPIVVEFRQGLVPFSVACVILEKLPDFGVDMHCRESTKLSNEKNGREMDDGCLLPETSKERRPHGLNTNPRYEPLADVTLFCSLESHYSPCKRTEGPQPPENSSPVYQHVGHTNAEDAVEISPEGGIAQCAELLMLVLVLVRQLCLEPG